MKLTMNKNISSIKKIQNFQLFLFMGLSSISHLEFQVTIVNIEYLRI